MRFCVATLLVVGSLATADEGKSAETAYLRAWYQLEVEEAPESAEGVFRKLAKDESLSAMHRAMCRVGIARCRAQLGDRAGAYVIYRSLLRTARDMPVVRARVERDLARLGPPAHDGEFQFHYRQGFQFRTGKVVEVDDADVVFRSCAGGISSVTLRAPGGITNLRRVLGREKSGLPPELLFGRVAAVVPSRLELPRESSGDSRDAETDVFILRTRDGGWAKLAITDRSEEGGWTEQMVTVRYRYNPDRPLFGPLPADAADEDGAVIFTGPFSMTLEETAREEQRAKERAEREQKRIKRRLRAAYGGGRMPVWESTQEVLLARRKHGDYEKATYSFRFGTRDDDEERVRNDWDLEFGNGSDVFMVRMVTDDRSKIERLGEMDWREIADKSNLDEPGKKTARTILGEAYLIHTVDDDTDYYTIVRVAAHKPGDRCLIEWVSLQGKELRKSPGLELDDDQEEKLMHLLRRLHDR
ncbi:MAG: hypothetical protein AAGD14_10065 [Planctomycetota bacterium]